MLFGSKEKKMRLELEGDALQLEDFLLPETDLGGTVILWFLVSYYTTLLSDISVGLSVWSWKEMRCNWRTFSSQKQTSEVNFTCDFNAS